jgi:F-type H+-transporting ATPase subunit b
MVAASRRLVVLVLVGIGLAFCSPGANQLALAADGAGPVQEVEKSVETAAKKTEEAMHDEPNPLAIDSDLAVWTFVVFVVLCLVLFKFAWKPIAEALERREHHIAENIAAAQRTHEDAKGLLAEYERKLAGAADQVRGMLEEARNDAEKAKQQIVAEAKSAAQAEHQRAMRDIKTATDAAVEELSQRSADLAVELAGKVISTKLTAEERSRLVQESLGKFAATSPSRN